MTRLLKEHSLMSATKTFPAIALLCLLVACGNNRSFDATAWQQGNPRIRGSMAEDLIKRKLLEGRSVDDVQQLLGRPDKDYGAAMVYQIDLGWPFKDPSHYGFVVELDPGRKVRGARIMD